MSTPQREPTLQERIKMTESFSSLIHNVALGTLIVAPVLILMPPRKLDLYTFMLSSAMLASTNQLVKERTGAGLLYQLPGARKPMEQRRLLEETISRPSVKENLDKHGWKEARLREEQEKLDAGEGYGSMIVDQIWDVWNQGENKMEEVKRKDEEVVQQKKKG